MLGVRAAKEALRDRAGGTSLEWETYADLRLGVEAVVEGLRKVRDERLDRRRVEVVVVLVVVVVVAEVMVGSCWPGQAKSSFVEGVSHLFTPHATTGK